MSSTWINRLGDWNPQLLREGRGRLKPRSLMAAVGLSLLLQGLIWLICRENARTPPLGEIDDERQWYLIWNALTWTLPYVLFTSGTFFIIIDLIQEQKRGTLSFVRSSPRPSQAILLGKLLGVPLLAYLSILVAVPLHGAAAIASGQISPLLLLSYYLMLAAGAVLFFSLAMLVGLQGGSSGVAGPQSLSAFVFAGLTLTTLAPLFMLWNQLVTWQPLLPQRPEWDVNSEVEWSYLPINQNWLLSHGFTLINVGLFTALCWRVLRRRFRQPSASLLSKRQSYALVAYLEILGLGFLLSSQVSVSGATSGTIAMYLLSAVFILVLTFALSPSRQALADWVRYRMGRSGWQPLIWADKSPAVLAIGINCLIAIALIVPWFILLSEPADRAGAAVIALISAISTTSALLIYAALTQRIFAAKLRNPQIWAAVTVLVIAFIPAIVLGILQLNPDRVPASQFAWTLFGYPYLGDADVIGFAIAAILLQWLILGLLLTGLTRHLRQLASPS